VSSGRLDRDRCRIDRTRVGTNDRLLTADETRTRLRCSPGTVENLVRRGFLEKVLVLSAVRYRESQVAAIVEHGTRRVSDVERLRADRRAAGRVP
jgi:hypothetical protein